MSSLFFYLKYIYIFEQIFTDCFFSIVTVIIIGNKQKY